MTKLRFLSLSFERQRRETCAPTWKDQVAVPISRNRCSSAITHGFIRCCWCCTDTEINGMWGSTPLLWPPLSYFTFWETWSWNIIHIWSRGKVIHMTNIPLIMRDVCHFVRPPFQHVCDPPLPVWMTRDVVLHFLVTCRQWKNSICAHHLYCITSQIILSLSSISIQYCWISAEPETDSKVLNYKRLSLLRTIIHQSLRQQPGQAQPRQQQRQRQPRHHSQQSAQVFPGCRSVLPAAYKVYIAPAD